MKEEIPDLFDFTNYFISKAKIRETIQKLKRLSDQDNGNEYCEFTIHILKQLLSNDYISKDKIREKIKEYEMRLKNMNSKTIGSNKKLGK